MIDWIVLVSVLLQAVYVLMLCCRLLCCAVLSIAILCAVLSIAVLCCAVLYSPAPTPKKSIIKRKATAPITSNSFWTLVFSSSVWKMGEVDSLRRRRRGGGGGIVSDKIAYF